MASVATAFVPGAGLGTRLRPLTNERPKPLVPLFDKPLITFAFDHLRAHGVQRFVVNTHHRPEAYETLLGARGGGAEYAGLPVQFRHEPVLLDTAGGVKNLEDQLGGEPFLMHNGDVLADLPLDRLIAGHFSSRHDATLALRSSGGPLHVQFDPQSGLVTDIRSSFGNRSEPAFLFTGISVLSPAIFRHIPAGRPYPLVTALLDLARAGGRVGGVILDEGTWFDLGTRSSYFEAHRSAAPSYPLDRPWPRAVHPDALLGPGVTLEGTCAIGPGAEVGEGAVLRDCLVWENAEIASRARLTNCIVRDGRQAGGDRHDLDF